MTRRSSFRRYLDYQSEFSLRWACWSRNHRGWCKMKKLNRKVAKKRMKREERGEEIP